jgi:hypothetical protein
MNFGTTQAHTAIIPPESQKFLYLSNKEPKHARRHKKTLGYYGHAPIGSGGRAVEFVSAEGY